MEKTAQDVVRIVMLSRVAIVASAAAICITVLAAFSGPETHVLRAEEFQLIDSSGKVLGIWGTLNGNPELRMVDGDGRAMVALVTSPSSKMRDPVIHGSWNPPLFPGFSYACTGTNNESSVIVHVGSGMVGGYPGFTAVRGEDTTARLQVGEEGGLLGISGGEASFGAINAFASASGAAINVNWNDAHSSTVSSESERAGFRIFTRGSEEPVNDDSYTLGAEFTVGADGQSRLSVKEMTTNTTPKGE